jgi:hypothetical protein
MLIFCQFILEPLAELPQDLLRIINCSFLEAIAEVLNQDLLSPVPEAFLVEVFSDKLRKCESWVFALRGIEKELSGESL